jgi:AraC-like DNA-binding protein
MKLSGLPPEAVEQVAGVTDGRVRVGPLMGIPGLLEELGQDPRAVIRSAGVDPRVFEQPESSLDFAAAGRLFARCAASTERSHFGLLLADTAGLESLGVLGLLVRHSPDVRTALSNLVLHLLVHDRGAVPIFAVERPQVFLGYSIYHPGVEGTRQIYDVALGIARNVMRTLCGAGWRPMAVQLPYRRPANLAPYRRFFEAAVQFDAARAAVIFPFETMSCTVRGADPDMYRELTRRVAGLEAAGGGDLLFQVRRVLRNLVLSGGGSIDTVARAFDINKRTLNRRLRDQDLSFKELLDETRYQIACQMLGESDLAIIEIASVLDYADAAAFTRAFRRWSGTTPNAWRVERRRP